MHVVCLLEAKITTHTMYAYKMHIYLLYRMTSLFIELTPIKAVAKLYLSTRCIPKVV